MTQVQTSERLPSSMRRLMVTMEGEIAQADFVTLKTVETQLGSCYRKLGITCRRELARALRGEPD